MKIDGKWINLTEEDANIVEAAARAGIGIPAPCYRGKANRGCCLACVVEIDGKQVYACGTAPEEGMEVVVRREDLDALRKERIDDYRNGRTVADGACGDCCPPDAAGAGCC